MFIKLKFWYYLLKWKLGIGKYYIGMDLASDDSDDESCVGITELKKDGTIIIKDILMSKDGKFEY